MQTFLPYPDFAESSAILDQARLGKQRVETLQVLRSLLIPTYGWQNHPVSRMWRGFIPGLTAYGLANVDAWTARGHADSTRDLIAEFAPEVVGMSQDELAAAGLLPRWIGDEQIHLSHRSNLIRKDAGFYGAIFPTTPGDLDYVWPGSGVGREPDLRGERRWVLRAADHSTQQRWREDGVVEISEKSPRGKDTPAWRAQVAEFVDALTPGTEIDVLVGNDAVLAHALVTGELLTRSDEQDRLHFVRTAEFVGETSRTDYKVPAVLQDPRSLFLAPLAAPSV
ncbi:MSMEG_6728 family protein [Naasia lichenicola]|uniref:Uncharacterized protein n=1 Tax=Naasia lichenicola TaxID=2565933 RepID=A0A4S4FT83_9MICO|nr:MSMEG_6728 family protein [Naasia lichenicola]THG33142.1 hypothetical protein E6C64_01925 [Naasia lichenicola]